MVPPFEELELAWTPPFPNGSVVDSLEGVLDKPSVVGEAGISTDTSKFPGEVTAPAGRVTAGTDKRETPAGTIPSVVGIVLELLTRGIVGITSEEFPFSTRLNLSEASCSEKSFCMSADLFDDTDAVVFVIFEATEFLELVDESEDTDPLLTLLRGGCSSSAWISVRDKVCVDGIALAGSKA